MQRITDLFKTQWFKNTVLSTVLSLSLSACGGSDGSSPGDDYTVTPSAMTFEGLYNDTVAPPAQTAIVKSLNGKIWLELDGGGYVNAALNDIQNDTATITVTPPLPAVVGIGEYPGSIRVHGYLNQFGSELADGSPQRIDFTYIVKGLDYTITGTKEFNSNYSFGSFYSELLQPVSISIRDSEDLSYGWQITIDEYNVNGVPSSDEWLVFDKMSGTSLPAEINVTVDASKLTESAGNNFKFTITGDNGYFRKFNGNIICTTLAPCQ